MGFREDGESREVRVVLSPEIYENLKVLAERKGLSLEKAAGWILETALEVVEDEILAEIALEREKKAESAKIPHEDFWK